MSSTTSATVDALLLTIDDPVLDMLNTMTNASGWPHDFWQNDVDISGWLVRTGWLAEPMAGRYPPDVLLAAMRHLHEMIRALVEAHKTSRTTSVDAPNVFLRQTPSRPVLVWESGMPHIKRLRLTDSVKQCLASLAEAVAYLFAEGDFQLVCVRKHPECTLWFYDRTRLHKRRWCGATVCGNRHKVTEYRKRQQG